MYDGNMAGVTPFGQCTFVLMQHLANVLFCQSISYYSNSQAYANTWFCMNYKTVKIQLKHSIIMQNFVFLMLCRTHFFNVMLRFVTLIAIMLVIIMLSAAFLYYAQCHCAEYSFLSLV
jgi:hypothetical protein